MKKDEIFFGENGLTATSANHVANLAKEFVSSIKNELEHISFTSSSMSIIGSSEKTDISYAIKYDEFLDIPNKIYQIIDANSLIAWLREGIKAKQKLATELNNMSIENWAKQNGIEYPVPPTRQHSLTEDEYMESLSIKDRNLIYHLQTKAAVIGGFIHPKGAYSAAREDFVHRQSNPHDVIGTGRDSIIYSFESCYNIDGIDNMFFELQKEYREAQAELNGLLHKRTSAIELDTISKNKEYAKANQEYELKVSSIRSQFYAFVAEENKRINDLKIVIPNDLKGIYETINSLGVSATAEKIKISVGDIDALAALKRKLAGED